MVRFNLYLPAPLVKKLRQLASEKDLSIAELVRRMLESELAKLLLAKE